jgi:serine/threonine protein kinase
MQTGDVLRGKYRLVRLLGDGGMGSVFEAHHQGLGTRVAIKVLHPELARRPGLVERFLREARVSAQIKSPNVVQVMDVETTDDGVAYIVMELLEGEPLSSVLEREGKLGVGVACDYARQILNALEAAHALGVVHRDLKPENVFLTTSPGHLSPPQAGKTPGSPAHLKLIDFGIAKARQMDSQARNLTIAGIVMGTPEYMAPEQAHAADKVDARSDLFAVGVMLYEMLSGSRPVTGDDARVVALKVERGEVRPLVHAAPGVPPDLAGLVHRAMAARPELRFTSAGEMRAALETVGLPVGDRLTGAMPATAGRTSAVPQRASAVPSPPSVQAAPQPRPSQQPPSVAAAAAGAARGTLMSDPTGEALRAPSQTPLGNYGSAWPGPGAPAGAYGAPPPPPPVYGSRGRTKKPGSAIWLLFGVPILLGGGIVAAFALNNANPAPQAPAPPSSPPPVNVAPTPTATSGSPTANSPDPNAGAPVAPLSPLNSPQTGPNPPARPQPGGYGPAPPGSGAKPHPSASSSAAPPTNDSPFPFPSGFPGIPNPFPSPSSSGVGPIITIPTSFPFPFPGGPAPPTPSSAPAPTPPASGKAI